MRQNRNNIVPVYDSEKPFRDCLYGWSVIIGMSFITLTIITIGLVLMLTYFPTSTTTTTNWPSSNVI